MRTEIKYSISSLLRVVIIPFLIMLAGLIFLLYLFPGNILVIILAAILVPIILLALIPGIISLLEKRAVLIENNRVTLGLFMGRLQFKTTDIKSAVLLDNNLYVMDHIHVTLHNESEWRRDLGIWQKFCVWGNITFFKSTVIIPSYLINTNANQLCKTLQPLAESEHPDSN